MRRTAAAAAGTAADGTGAAGAGATATTAAPPESAISAADTTVVVSSPRVVLRPTVAQRLFVKQVAAGQSRHGPAVSQLRRIRIDGPQHYSGGCVRRWCRVRVRASAVDMPVVGTACCWHVVRGGRGVVRGRRSGSGGGAGPGYSRAQPRRPAELTMCCCVAPAVSVLRETNVCTRRHPT